MIFRQRYRETILVGVTICIMGGVTFAVFSLSVSSTQVFGTYVASYPFGTSTVTLNRDGTFIQRVAVTSDPPPVISKGRWSFNSDSYSDSYVTFYDGYLNVDDGFGRLRRDWRVPEKNSVAVPPVRRKFFRILINPEAKYPYVKQ